jgi:hypothetical protein
MAGILEQFLGGVFGANALQSYSHASRLYLDDYYKYAPKNGWIYYVQFSINSNTGNQLVNHFIDKNGGVIGMLVKTADLPKFRMATEVLNQYNRRTYIQNKIEYQPIAMTLHDDHNNTSTSLWEAYYRYYFADDAENTYLYPTPPVKYGNIKYTAEGDIPTSYGLNNGIKDYQPFFRYIELFQLNRQQYTSFRLINPIITDWSHDNLNQSEGKFLENKMTVGYEAVKYLNGRVGGEGSPDFNKNNYDKTPSPLSILGKGNNSIAGPGGIIDGVSELLGGAGTGGPEFAYPLGGSLDSGVPGKNLNPFQQIKGALNLAKNLKNVSAASIGAEAFSIAGGALGSLASGKGLGNSLGSLAGGPGGLAAVAAGAAGGIGKIFSNFSSGNSSVNKLTTAKSGLNNSAPVQAAVAGSAVNAGDSVAENNAQAQQEKNNPPPGGITDLDIAQAESDVNDAEAKVSDIQDQIAKNEEIKAQYQEALDAANESGDIDAISRVMGSLKAAGYTDPAELQNNLAQAQTNLANANTSLDTLNKIQNDAINESIAESTDPVDEPSEEDIQSSVEEANIKDQIALHNQGGDEEDLQEALGDTSSGNSDFGDTTDFA